MAPNLLSFMLLVALSATAILFWARMHEQAYERRVRERLDATRHLAAVVRAYFAERRQTA
ncbi:MAG TPA: hypothetical protein VK838_03340 [Candidatus Limnocylindrales bacterium]|nr:hypothetical protein [Candidatus Limnocylindrales bacterium]